MIYRKLFFVYFFLLMSIVQGQTTKKLFFESEYGNKIVKKILTEAKMDSIIFIYQGEFVIDESPVFDKKRMKETLDKRIPNINQKGYAVLDWEGNSNLILYGYKKVSDEEYVTTRNNYIASIQYAKKLRPKMKWAFYNYPPMDYVNTGKIAEGHDAFVQKNMLPILKIEDFLTPSLYVSLDDRTAKSDSFTYSYAKSNTEYAIKLGIMLKKPVYPVIWHRYSSPNRSHGLVELPYFETYVKSIIDTKYKGKGIDGLIWWNCENYVYKIKKDFKSAEKEYQNVTDKDQHQDTIFHNYYRRILKNLNK
jgi:hypothetical protein